MSVNGAHRILLTRNLWCLINAPYHHMSSQRNSAHKLLGKFTLLCSLALMPHNLCAQGQVTTCYRTLRPSRSESVTFTENPRRDAISTAKCASMQRRGFDILKSVIAYLNWRVESAHVPFTSWHNQPAELGWYVHAINLCNQAKSLSDGAWIEIPKTLTTDDASVEGSAAECPSGRSAESLPVPKKPPQSVRLNSIHHGENHHMTKQLLLSLVEQMVDSGVTYREFIHEVKKQYVSRVILSKGGNFCRAARELNMHRNTLARTVVELGIDVEALKPKPARKESAMTALLTDEIPAAIHGGVAVKRA